VKAENVFQTVTMKKNRMKFHTVLFLILAIFQLCVGNSTKDSTLKNNIGIFATGIRNIGINYDRVITNHMELFAALKFSWSLPVNNFLVIQSDEFVFLPAFGVDHTVYSIGNIDFSLQYFMSGRLVWTHYKPGSQTITNPPIDFTASNSTSLAGANDSVLMQRKENDVNFFPGTGFCPGIRFRFLRRLYVSIGITVMMEIESKQNVLFPATKAISFRWFPVVSLGVLF
jgi:hypothetical protein